MASVEELTAKVEELTAKVEELAAMVARLERRQSDHEKASRLYVTNRELDQPKGDPVVRFDPRGWRGASCKGKPFSRCPPEYLDLQADYLAWSAENPKEGKEKFSGNNRMQARLARSWARRLRARAANGTNGAEPEPKKSAWGAPPPARSGAPPVDAAQAPGESAASDPLADDDDDPLGGLDDEDEDPLGLDSPGHDTTTERA